MGSPGFRDCWYMDRLIAARWKSPGGRAVDNLVSVDQAILVSSDLTVGAWDWESSYDSMGSTPPISGLDLDMFLK